MPDKKMADDYLREWRDVCLLEDQITMTQAADSLGKDNEPLIEAKCGSGQRASTWMFYNKSTKEEAILVHAGIWSWNADLDTGNFVPVGEKPPSTVTESRVQNSVSFKCDVSHAIDTTIDESLWDNLEVFEKYIQKMEGFNRSQRDRSPWQDGSRRTSYIISSKLFVRKSVTMPKELDFEPHEWLKKGIKAQMRQDFVINPARPRYYDLVEGKLIKLQNAVPAYFKKGDIVWFAFKLAFFIGKENWAPEIIPVEFVRVALGDGLYIDRVEEGEIIEQETKEKVGDAMVPTKVLPKRLEEGQSVVVITRIDRKGSSTAPAVTSDEAPPTHEKRKSEEVTDEANKVSSDDSTVNAKEIEGEDSDYVHVALPEVKAEGSKKRSKKAKVH
ncbi:hypothetical protein CVT26_000575 [Gymnopilus dilepis]|uniref:Uncharacterized protein n=1 Tax=Gymnopilus dilepis TaxID=231916 RepID=A0A409VH92_9AGAR|nr:hypothetical protein CVT26_000575 [Gymnopilus dilepis]